MSDPRDVLEGASTVAVVGISTDPEKPSHSVPAFMKSVGFRIVPVNPHVESVLGERSYPSLTDLPHPVDVVNVFRAARHAPEIARQAVAIGARAVWLQEGIRSDEARTIAEAAGLAYVEDRCMRSEAKIHRIRKDRGEADQDHDPDQGERSS